MDQTQWKALNQMLSKQTASSGTQKASSVAGAQAQYKTVVAGNQQQQYVIVPGNSSQVTPSATGRTASGQRAARQSVNGATRAQAAASGDTEIVKSLLTGRQYGQSILRPDVGRGSRQQGRTAGSSQAAGQGKTTTKQVSLLQSNWQQNQQQVVDANQTSTIQIDPSGVQQLVCTQDMIPEGLGPGEVMYMMVGDVTYQIVGPAKPGGDVSGLPVASGISLDDLATISAQQESLKPELSSYQLQAGDASSGTTTVVSQDVLQSAVDGQQFLQTMPDGTITTMTEDGMQIVMMTGDGYSESQAGKEGESTSTIKLGGQDFVLQAGQHLPAELQEMVAKGLPIDWSNYEFVIEGETSTEGTDTFMMASAADQSEALGLQEMGMMASASGDVGSTIGAESSNAYAVISSSAEPIKSELIDEVQKSVTVQVVTACPGEYDDGEFAYLAASSHEEDSSQAGASEGAEDDQPRTIPYSGFLNSFLDFVQGKGTETLSSVANSSITNKPPLPKYVPETGSKVKEELQQKYKGTPMTVIYTDCNDPSGRTVSYILSGGSGDSTDKGKQVSNAGKRKRNQMDSEGEDLSGENAEKLYKMSEDGFDSEKKEDSSTSVRGRARGKGRGSGTGRPTLSESTRVGLLSLLEPPVLDSPVVHVTQSEPHFYQKGDFVIDRKDAYKLDSYPIWRIENGKLLQKFDPALEDGILIHKSASVYSSWSGDIKANFKPIMVEVISTAATSVGRKQDIRVHVLDKYQTKAPDDSLEQNPLLQLFNIYLHVLLNQVIEPSYLSAVLQQKVEYYFAPMVQIDQLLVEAEQAVLSEITWKDEFKAELDTWSCYTVVGLRADQVTLCQATAGANKGVMTVKFYGQTYDHEMLTVTSEASLNNAKEFAIGKATFDRLGIYHSLHHFKFLLFTKCQEEVNYLKQVNGKSSEEAVEECIQNRIWVQQLFLDLKGLLERYIIIKTEDEAGDGDASATH